MKKFKLFFTPALLILMFQISISAQNIPTTLSEIYGEGGFGFETGIKKMDSFGGNWTPGANMPFPRYYGASIMYSRNDTTWLYVFGGDTTGNGIATRACLRYNVNTNIWEYISSLPTPMRVNAAARLGDKLYTMGGFDSPFPNLEITKFYEYDVNTNSWSELPELPERVFFHRAFGHQDSLIYIIGGMQTATSRDLPSSRVMIYNTIQNSFLDGEPLPEGIAEGSVAKRGDKFFIIGGIVNPRTVLELSDRNHRADINPVNPLQITYSSMSDYTLQVRASYSYIKPDGKVHIFGGFTSLGFTPTNISYHYNIEQNTYEQKQNTPYPAGAFMAGYRRYTNSRSDFVHIIAVMTGGITTGPSLTGQTWIYRDSVKVTGLSDTQDNLPDNFLLQQNYPNPFNPTTTIQFSIPEQSFMTIEVFNTLGEKITTLVSEELNAGNYKYEWNASNLPSGIYFYKLNTEKFSEIKKMILIK